MSKYHEMLVDLGLQADIDALKVKNMVAALYPIPNEDTLRRLYGLLRMTIGFRDNDYIILKKYCPNDPEPTPEFQRATARFCEQFRKVLEANR